MKTHSKVKDNQVPTTYHLRIVSVTKQRFFEPLFVTSVLLTAKTEALIYFEPDRNVVTKEFLSVKCVVGAILNRQFFIVVSNTSTESNTSTNTKYLEV